MKILGVIDHFGSGGAQRQMVELLCGLRSRNHDVEVFIYHGSHEFFRSRVVAAGIGIHQANKKHRFSPSIVGSLSSLLRLKRYDVALSYLATPSIYAELARITTPNTALVVSERSSHHADAPGWRPVVRRQLHRLADHVVVNSTSHQTWLQENHPWLRGKVSTIYNGYDLSQFTLGHIRANRPHELALLGIGRVAGVKNIVGLIQGLEVFRTQFGWVPSISWAGRRDSSGIDGQYADEIDQALRSCPVVAKSWRWLGEQRDVVKLLQEHDALVHPSIYEGLPNVVCEALSCGRPVLLSDVSDHAELAGDGRRGLLFDPADPTSIADALHRFAEMSTEQRATMGLAAREYAESTLTVERMVSKYEDLFRVLVDWHGGQEMAR